MKFTEEKLEKTFAELLGKEGFRRTANAFGSTFTFFTETQTNTKKCKRATKLAQQDTVNNGQQSNDKKEQRRHNSTYPKGGVSGSKDSFVVNQTLVFQIKFSGKNPALRVAVNHYASCFKRNHSLETA
jgi:hypothetical protein